MNIDVGCPQVIIIYKNIFFSKEPGYYEDEQFGIRLENIFMVKEVETTVNMIKVLWICTLS